MTNSQKAMMYDLIASLLQFNGVNGNLMYEVSQDPVTKELYLEVFDKSYDNPKYCCEIGKPYDAHRTFKVFDPEVKEPKVMTPDQVIEYVKKCLMKNDTQS